MTSCQYTSWWRTRGDELGSLSSWGPQRTRCPVRTRGHHHPGRHAKRQLILGQRIQVEFLHGVVLEVVGDEGQLMVKRHGGNGCIRGGQGDALAAVVTLQFA